MDNSRRRNAAGGCGRAVESLRERVGRRAVGRYREVRRLLEPLDGRRRRNDSTGPSWYVLGACDRPGRHLPQRLFAAKAAPLAWLRNAGLNLTDRLPVIKNLLIRQAMS